MQLLPFEMAVRDADPAGVMCAFPEINGTWVCESEYLLTTKLRDEWGFEGHVVSDWSLYDYTNKNQAFYAGTDVNLTTTLTTGQMQDAESATAVKAMRRCMHHYLYSIASHQEELWSAYLEALERNGGTRDPAKVPPPPARAKGGCGHQH